MLGKLGDDGARRRGVRPDEVRIRHGVVARVMVKDGTLLGAVEHGLAIAQTRRDGQVNADEEVGATVVGARAHKAVCPRQKLVDAWNHIIFGKQVHDLLAVPMRFDHLRKRKPRTKGVPVRVHMSADGDGLRGIYQRRNSIKRIGALSGMRKHGSPYRSSASSSWLSSISSSSDTG